MKYKINGIEYELVKNIKEGFDYETLCQKYTDYFEDYDYILGDWSYGQLRLKGFYNSNNSKAKELNDIKYVDDYLKNNCAFECKWFLLKK